MQALARQVNRMNYFFSIVQVFNIVLRSLLIALFFSYIWFRLNPYQPLESLLIFLLTFVSCMFLDRYHFSQKIAVEELSLYLDMKNLNMETSIYELANSSEIYSAEWEKTFYKTKKKLFREHLRRLLNQFSTLLFPLFYVLLQYQSLA